MTIYLRLSIALLALTLSVSLFAQPPSHRGHGDGHKGKHSEAHKQARKEVRAYLEENALPVITETRETFDALLSEAEKATLSEIRTEMHSLRQQHKALRDAHKNSQQAPTEAERQERQALRKQQRALMERVHDIADVHEAALEKALEGLHEEGREWRKEIRSIMEKYRPNKDSIRPHGERADRGHRPGHGPKHAKGHDLRRVMHPVGFLLWEPGQWHMDELKAEQHTSSLKAYPNPSAGTVMVMLENTQQESLEMELLTPSGKRPIITQTVLSTSLPYRLDVSTLDKGVYILRITDGDEIYTEKIFVE